MASIDAEVAKRCFIVCGPPVPPIYAMKDAFCRFGNLIDVYMLPGKNCGYAKYATIDSANEAIEVLYSLPPLMLIREFTFSGDLHILCRCCMDKRFVGLD